MNISQYDRRMNLVKWELGNEHIVHIGTIEDSNVNVVARLEQCKRFHVRTQLR